jgi:hypothetical protein
MKKLQRLEHQRLSPGRREKSQQLQWASYRHFLHDRYENPKQRDEHSVVGTFFD